MSHFWQALLSSYGGRMIGAIAGLILALVVLQYGLLRTVFILVLVFGGYYVGLRFDEEGEPLSLEKLMRKR